ncbi:MAG TPA: hypothetical protein VF702_09790 [Allosphingosinicella sp.]|jgi:hypothetical protein
METATVDAVIFAILTTGAVLIATQLARLLRAAMHHRTIREAISRDNQSVSALLETLDREEQQPTGANDDRTGLVLIALGAALFLYTLIQGETEGMRNIGAAAVFPFLVGTALLVRFQFIRRRGKSD